MGTFRIQPHGRLHEWVADELGFFREEGLQYEFVVDFSAATLRTVGVADVKSGAYESFEAGRACEVSSACHWVTNHAAANNFGRMYGGAYSVCPAGIYVAPESDLRRPEDLAHVKVGVGYHSGSHFSAVQALESFLDPDAIELQFIGHPGDRLAALFDRAVPAVNVFGAPLYALEQLGFRKVADTTFMMGHLYAKDADEDQVRRFFRAMRRAQMEIDLRPERYRHYHLKALPERFRGLVDVRTFGCGERVVFLEYTAEMFEQTQAWMATHAFFDQSHAPRLGFDMAVGR